MSYDITLRTSSFVGNPSGLGKGKEEEPGQASIDLQLPDDVLSVIFNYATNGCRDRKASSAILEVNCRWRNVFDANNLRSSWGTLQEKVKSHVLRDLVDQMAFVDCFVSRVLTSAICSNYTKLTGLEFKESKKTRLLNRIESAGPSSFVRFSYLTRELRKQGAPIPDMRTVIGFEFSSYERMQQSLDTALETIWMRIQQQIDFEGVPIPASAQAIRGWLNDPINADKIACVTELNLDQMDLKVLPSEIGCFSQLTRLNLYGNELASLPSTIGNLSQLKSLNLSGNQLASLSSTIGNLSQLKSLNLSGNQLASLPSTIGNLSQLTNLYLSGNQIRSLPSTIGNLSQLKWLEVANNQLTSLPPTIGNLSQLDVMHLSENQLTSLPSTIGRLFQISELSLHANRLTSLPSTVGKLSQLKSLCLQLNLFIFILDSDLRGFNFGDTLYFFDTLRFHDVINKLMACSYHACRTPFASLCQVIHRGEEEVVLRNAFQRLSDEMQQRIRGAWAAIPSSSSSSSEVGADLFADRTDFVRAVMIAIKDKWQSLSVDQRTQIYAQAAVLAEQPDADADWGKAHAEENIIRLIDAMELTTDATSPTTDAMEPTTDEIEPTIDAMEPTTQGFQFCTLL